eukprot:6285815-Amphidinium_carterae.1
MLTSLTLKLGMPVSEGWCMRLLHKLGGYFNSLSIGFPGNVVRTQCFPCTITFCLPKVEINNYCLTDRNIALK